MNDTLTITLYAEEGFGESGLSPIEGGIGQKVRWVGENCPTGVGKGWVTYRNDWAVKWHGVCLLRDKDKCALNSSRGPRMDNTLGSLFPSVEPMTSPATAAPAAMSTDAGEAPSNGAFMRELTRGAETQAGQREMTEGDVGGERAPSGATPAQMMMMDPAWQDQIAAAQLPGGMPAGKGMARVAQEVRSILRGLDPNALMNNAAIALMTGKLDRLDPASIPSIVARTPFLQEAMAAPDIGQFMDVPMRLGDILRGLRINPEQVNGLQPDSLNRMVSANDVVKALGLDAQQVRAELTALQNNLLVDGVSPYMVRAAALRGAQKKGGQREKTPMDMADKGERAGKAASQKQAKDDPTALMMAAGMAGQQAVATNPPVNAPTPKTTMNPKTPGGMPFGQAPIASAPAAGAGVAAGSRANSEMLAMMEPVAPMAADRDVMNALSAKPTAAPKTAGTVAAVDPFATMGREMASGADVVTTAFAPESAPASQPSAAEVLRDQMMRQTKPAASPVDVSTVASATSAAGVVDRTIAPADPMTRFAPSNHGGDDLNRLVMETTAPGSANARGAGRVTARGVAAVGAVATASGERDSTGPASDGVERRSEGESGESVMVGPTAHQSKSEFAKHLEKNAPAEQAAPKPEMVRDVFDKAHMMVREGGGSMRVDLPTPWGKVDVAVKVDNGNVQVRMLSDSPQVRDALNQDLSRLRDSLAGQNLSLGSVEVGVGGGNAWAQNFGQQGFEAGRNLEELREYQSATGNRVTSARRQASRAIERVTGGPRVMNRADGGIEVLV